MYIYIYLHVCRNTPYLQAGIKNILNIIIWLITVWDARGTAIKLLHASPLMYMVPSTLNVKKISYLKTFFSFEKFFHLNVN